MVTPTYVHLTATTCAMVELLPSCPTSSYKVTSLFCFQVLPNNVLPHRNANQLQVMPIMNIKVDYEFYSADRSGMIGEF